MAEVKIENIQIESNEPPAKLEKVIKGDVKTSSTKKNKIASEFVKEEPSYVRDYIVGEVILPAVKNLVADIINNATQMFLFGKVSGRSDRDSRTRYSSRAYECDDRPRQARDRYNSVYRDFSDIVMSSRADAVTVLNDLKDQIEDYGCATVANFYELVGEDSTSNDNKYGWTNLSRAYVDSVRGGYIIEFPKPRRLD